MYKLKTFSSLLINLNEKFLYHINEFSLMSEASHFDFEPFKDHIGLRYFSEISGANDPL